MELASLAEFRVLLLGFTVPEDVTEQICRSDRYMPVQTHKFAWCIVRGLEANGAAVDLLSSEPVGTYPSNKRVFFGFRRWDRENGSWNVMMPFINLMGLKHVTRFLASLFFVCCWLFRSRKERKRCILLHGVHSPYMYAVLALKKFFSIKVATIATDPPGVVLPGEGILTRALRLVDTGLILKALRSMDGLIAITSQLAQHFAPQVPSTIVEGILYAEDDVCLSPQKDAQAGSDAADFTILYAGGLHHQNGIDLLLKAFALTDDPSFRLWFLGKGDCAEQIQSASDADHRIVFKGYCSQSEVKQLLGKATVLINPRPAKQSFTEFSFPSKTIEYMVSGRPVISTRLPGIPEEYFAHVFALEKETPEELSALFTRLKAMPRGELEAVGANGRKFILDNKSETHQGRRILAFLENC